MDRRTFLQRSSLGLAALALGCSSPDAAPVRASRAGGRTNVLVIGAGIAGLVAAYRLAQRGLAVTVLEAAGRVGGRMTTDVVNGYVIDRGAQFLSTAYEVIPPLLQEVGLSDRLVLTSEWSAIVRDGLPRRVRNSDPSTQMTGGLLGPADWSLLAARYFADAPAQNQISLSDYSAWAGFDDQDARVWSDSHYNPTISQYIVEPLIQGFYFQALDGTSRALATAVLSFAYHSSASQSLNGGIGLLPERLAQQLDVRLATEATGLEVNADGVVCHAGGQRWDADHVVLATPATVARELYASASAVETRLMSTGYSSTVRLTIVTTRNWHDHPELEQVWGVLIPEGERDIVAAVGIESFKNPAYVPQGEILNVMLTGKATRDLSAASDDTILRGVVTELARYFPGLETSIAFTRILRWPAAEPLSPIGRAHDLAEYRGASKSRRVFLAGDYMSMPWTDGAAESGTWVAEQIAPL